MPCNLLDTGIEAPIDFKDTMTYSYQADFGEVIIDPALALTMAQSMGPKPVPVRRHKHPSVFAFVTHISGKRLTEKSRHVWQFDVTYGPPPAGEDEDQQNENPLLRPPVYNIQYIEEEYVVKQAYNLDDLGSQFAAGARYRPAGTLGPIENGAGIRPDEPIVRTRRKGVIVIEKNFANLGAIMAFNEDFFDTTNSDSVTIGSKTFGPRRLKYEVATSLGKQVENGYTFYPAIVEISIHKTTDLIHDNVGYHYFDTLGKKKRFQDDDGIDTAEPDNLNLTGTSRAKGEPAVQLRYRDLEAVPYAVFFS